MRTTITLDDDVAARLRDVSLRSGKSFKQAVNDAVRAGLAPPAARKAAPFVQPRFSMGRSRVDLTKANSLAGDLEDQETLAKSATR
jgi:hypothetical protein